MSWPLVKLKDCCDIIMGQAPKGDTYNTSEKGYALIAGAGDFGNTVPLPKKFTTKPTRLSAAGDLILCIRATIGDINWSDQVYCLGRGVAGLRPFENIDAKYLWYFIKSNKRSLEAEGTGSTFKHVSRHHIENWQLPLPPLEEQKRIAAILDKADYIRQKRQQAIKMADQFLRSVFLDMFGDPVTNPKGWDVIEISNVCTDIVDCVNRTAPAVEQITPYKMIRTTNVRNHRLNLDSVRYVEKDVYEKWTRRLKPELGDIIFTREAPAGEAGVVETEDLIFLGQRTMHFRPDMEKVNSTYLLYELMSAGVKDQIRKLSTGSTVTHLSVPECKRFKVRVPPVQLQNEFSYIASKLNRVKNSYEEGSTSPLFESLSKELFSA